MMINEKELKGLVMQRYNDLESGGDCIKKYCCNPMSFVVTAENEYMIMSEDYSQLKGYEPDVDFGVGCGLPTLYAHVLKRATPFYFCRNQTKNETYFLCYEIRSKNEHI